MNPEYVKALQHFKQTDPLLFTIAKKYIPELSISTTKKTNEVLFRTLCESVVSQQLSVKAADTIWERLEKICGGTITVECIRKATPARMRTAGLSAAKVKTLKELAKAVSEGLVLSSLRRKTAEEAMEILTSVWGIGPWTTEMFLMFGLNHPDVFSVKDLGLVRAMEMLYSFPKNTAHRELEAVAQVWSPHRTLASRVLWKYRDSKR